MFPFLLILAYLILVLVRPQEYPALVDSGIPLLPIALLGSLVTWVFSRDKRLDAPQYILVVLFLFATCLSLIISGWSGGAMDWFVNFAPVIVSFVLLANAVNTRGKTLAVMIVFVASAALMAVHGIDQKANGLGWTGMPLVDDGRIQYLGIFSDPNDVGLLLVMSIPMAMYLGSRGGLMGLRRLFWTAAAALLMYGVYLTNSRGALIAVITMAGVYVWLTRGTLLALVLAGISFVGLRLMPTRMGDIDVQESSAMGRVDAWYEGIQMFIGHPFFGVGTNRFTEYHHLTAHNSFVLVLAENGFFGFMIWLAFVVYCFWMMAQILKHEPEVDLEGMSDAEVDEIAISWRNDRALALTLLISLCGFFAASFFLSRSYVILLYLLAALVVAHFAGVRDRFPSVPGFDLRQDLVRWPVITVIAIIALYGVVKLLLAIG